MVSAITGFTLSLSMIIPLGTQNSMLLNQSIHKNHHLVTAALFILYDAMLITTGVFGGSILLSTNELLFTLLTWGGILFLTVYGAMSFKSAIENISETTASTFNNKTMKIVIITGFMVTFLNPHVFIDTVMVIGSVGGQYSGEAKLYFLIGAITASAVWFSTLALGAARLSPVLSKPKVKRIIDLFIGIVMWFIAWSLLITWLAS